MLSFVKSKIYNQLAFKDEFTELKSYKILIIHNITKISNILIDYSNSLGLLTPSNNQTFLQKDVFETIQFGRLLGFEIDLYFLSYDYGLLHGDIHLPNYDNTMKRKTISTMEQRGKELHIAETLSKLPKFDLVYLDIPEEQLTLLDSEVIQSKAPEIIYFATNFYYSPPFLGLDINNIKNKINNRSFLPIKIENNFRMSLLVNYFLVRTKFSDTFLQFIQALIERSTYF